MNDSIRIPDITMDAIGLNRVAEELKRARSMHKGMNSAHEAYSVILEELDEFWDEVKKKRERRDTDAMGKELIQIAAMAIRAASDLGITPMEEST